MNEFFKLAETQTSECKVYELSKNLEKKEPKVYELDKPIAKDVIKEVECTLGKYFDDLKSKSEVPDTIPDKPFKVNDFEKLSPEKNQAMREEFMGVKGELKKQWEEKNGKSWPKYDKDIYSANDKLIRKAGSDYDAHHIQPLGLGGKNEVDNITPLNAEVHYDKQGIHSQDSPYSKLDKML